MENEKILNSIKGYIRFVLCGDRDATPVINTGTLHQ